MSKRGVFWGLGGLLGVVLATTLCLLLVTVMGTGAQNSSQSSVEPQVTNLPTGEASDHTIARTPEVEPKETTLPIGEASDPAIARTPGVEPGPPLVPSLFQPVAPPTVSLDPLPAQITEGEDLTVTVRLDRVVSYPVTVELRFFDEFSEGLLEDRFLTIDPGNLFAQLIVPTTDDVVVRGHRNVVLELNVVDPVFGVDVVEDFREFILLDNEPTVSLDPLPEQITEGEDLTVTVRLNRVVDFEVTVRLEVNVFPDTGPPDYTLSRSTATIAPGDLFATFIISTIDDDVVEGDEFVESVLRVVSPSIFEVGVGTSFIYSIRLLDNEPTVSLDPVPRQVTEGESLTITARLNRVVDYTVTVHLEVDVSPDIGLPDYTLSRSTATIAPGELFSTFTINTIDDDVYEGDEFVESTLSVVRPELDVGLGERFGDFILLDNEPTVSLDSLPRQVTEGDNLTVAARLDRVVDYTVTVNLGVEIYGRVGSPDYKISPPTAAIPAGRLTAEFTLNTVDDNVAEEDEYGVLLLRVVGASAGVGEGSRGFILKDNDPVMIQFDSVAPVTEGEDRMITVRLNRPFSSDLRFDPPEKIGGDAEDGDYDLDSFQSDYYNSDPILLIPSGDLTATFTFRAIDDGIYEGTETVILGVSRSFLNLNDIGDTIEVTIVDGDQQPTDPVVSLDPVQSQVREGDILTVTARLSHRATFDVEVEIEVDWPFDSERCQFDPVCQLSDPEDYMISPPLSKIMAGELTATFMFSAVDSDIYEFPETWRLRLRLRGSGAVEGNTERSFLLVDNEPDLPMVSFDPEIPQVVEGESLRITVHLGRELESDMWVRLDTRRRSESGDFSASCVRVQAGRSTVSLPFRAEDDDIYEGPEYETMVLRRYATRTDCENFGFSFGHYSIGLITIIDNDPIPLEISLSPAVLQVTEGEDLTITVRFIREEKTTDVYVWTEISPAFSSGLEHGEYIFSPSSFRIPDDELTATATFTFSTLDDDIYEGTERVRFWVDIQGLSSLIDFTSASYEFEVIVEDNEDPPPQVTLSVGGNISTIMEGGSVNLIATLAEDLPGGVPEPLTVELAVEGVSDGDYSLPGEIVIDKGNTMGVVELTITDDNLAEFAEQLTIKVAQLGYGTNRVAPQVESSVGLTIETDPDDLITATITASDTAEGDTVTVTIELTSPLPSGLADDALQLVVRNMNRRADFGALDENGTLNLVELFGDGTTTVVLLPVVDDMIFEVQEQGRLTVEGSPELDSQFTKITGSSDIYAEVRFKIIDNETVRIVPRAPVTGDYGPEITTVMEFGVFEVFAELAPGVTADRDVTVEFEYKFDSTDENGNVRTPLRCEEISLCDPHIPNSLKRQVTIMEGETRSSRRTNIGILQDMIAEETKLFQLVPTRTVPETTFDSTPIHITVLDNDTLTYEIRGADEIDENAGSYTVQLRRKGTITADAMVPYTVSGGDSSPASEADFDGNAFPSGSFTFTGYDALSDEVSIMIENDGVSEVTETFKISVTGGTSTPKEVAIIDDDPPGMPPVVVGFDPVTYTVGEASGTVELTVSILSGAPTEAIMLAYAVSDVMGSDYTLGIWVV